MDKIEALATLEKNKIEMMKQFKIGQQIESEIIERTIADSEPFGPRDDIEFARVLRDIKQS